MRIRECGVRVRAAVGAVAMAAMLGVAVPAGAQQASAPAPQKLTFPGELALWTVAIKPDKTAAFEQIMGRVRDALAKSPDADRQKQAAGWKVMKIEKPLPDGNIAYVHVISPVVPNADYTVMQILYDAFPDDRQALYETYRSAFAANLSLATGSIAVDLSHAPAAASVVGTR
jgi:hypothetical protein